VRRLAGENGTLRAAAARMAHALLKALRELEAQASKLGAKAEGQAGLGPRTVLVESVAKHFRGVEALLQSLRDSCVECLAPKGEHGAARQLSSANATRTRILQVLQEGHTRGQVLEQRLRAIGSAAEFLQAMVPEVWGDVTQPPPAAPADRRTRRDKAEQRTPEPAKPRGTPKGGSATRLRRAKRSALLAKISGLRSLNLPAASGSSGSP